MRLRLQPKQIESIFDTNDVVAIDTLDSGNDAVQVVLYSNNTWKYVRNREIAKDSTIFEKYWDTTTLFPYKEVDMSSMPKSVVIDLVDSLTELPLPLSGLGASARQIRSAAAAPASGRRPAAEDGRPGLRHVLRPRAHFGIQQGRLRQPGHHPPRQRAGDLLRAPFGAHGRTRTSGSRPGQIIGLGGSTGRCDGSASAFRDPLLRAVVRPRAADRLQERHC